MKYEIFLITGEWVAVFESNWHFKEYEHLFYNDGSERRNFIITRVTHDIYGGSGHTVRLYCQEKKVYGSNL